MTHHASLARFALFTSLAVVLASACGGQSFTTEGGGASAGKGQGGSGSDQAGTAGTAGKKGHAGNGTGGSSAGTDNAGGSNAGTGNGGTGNVGTSGAGGGVSEACGAPPQSGNCDASIPSWYHEPGTGICRPFVYGGCGGNANRYGSLEDCQNACPGGSPNYDACKLPSDCIVTGTGCCGICDSPNVMAHDLIAYNRQYQGLLACPIALSIASGGASAGATAPLPIACAPCIAPPPGQGTLQFFVPDCVQGQCVVEDLRTSPVTACKTSDECKLRHGTGCCESCGSDDVVAVRNDGSFEELVCSGSTVACDPCAPAPTGAVPSCTDGRCTVAIAAHPTAK